ncbi:hypothetical protein [Streptomyces niveus]|uniref:hypothetical protein n=1 Tax=Streptomyces niveus TaxID=193462 RepID=UPI0036CE13CC
MSYGKAEEVSEYAWGAQRTPLPAPPLRLDPAQCDGELDSLALRTFVVSAPRSAP